MCRESVVVNRKKRPTDGDEKHPSGRAPEAGDLARKAGKNRKLHSPPGWIDNPCVAKSQKPQKPKKPVRTARRARMVAAQLKGASHTAIAQAEGLSRTWTGQELRSPECRQIILELVEQHRERIGKLFVKTLKAIEDAYGADKTAVSDFQVLNMGPDHYARLGAAKRLLEVISLGRPTAQPATSKVQGGISLLELENAVSDLKAKAAVQ